MENDKTEILGEDKTEFVGNDRTELIMPVVAPSVDEKTEQNPPTVIPSTEVLPKSAINRNPVQQNKTVELKYREHFLDSNKAVYTKFTGKKSGLSGGNVVLVALIVLVLLAGAVSGFYVMNHPVEETITIDG